MGAAGTPTGASDDEFNRTSFLSHFEGANNGVNNVFDDSSASNHTVTANANITQGSFSPFSRPDGEWGVAFDGTGDYLTVAASNDFDVSDGDITIEGFFNFTSNAAISALWTFTTNSSDANGIRLLRFTNGYLSLNVRKDNSYILDIDDDTILTPLNTWHHIAVTRTSGGAWKVYVNGVIAISGTESASSPSTAGLPLSIGANYQGTDLVMNGHISNFRVVKGTLVYTSNNFTPPTGKLTAITNTKLLTCQSNRFVDNSASAHTVTPSGDPAVTAFGPFLTSSVYDAAVNGASMQGFATTAGDSVQIAQTTDTNLTGDFTVECWVYFNGLDGSHGLLAKVNPSDNAVGFIFYAQDSSQSNGFTFQIRNNGSTSGIANIASGVFATTGQWYHVAACRTGTTVSMFVNGVRHATGTTSNNGTISSITSIGNYYSSSNARYVEGYICDARIINGTAAYDGATYTIPTAPLTAVTNTKLLLNMADGQAIDSTAQDNIKLVGNAKISTAQKKFGDASMVFAASSGALAPKDFLAFGSGNFTVEFFVRFDNPSSLEFLIDGRPSATNGAYFTLYSSAGLLKYSVSNTVRITGSSALDADTFYHVAVCRSGTDTKMFVDGTQIGSTYSDSNSYLTSDLNQIGGYAANSNFTLKGYMDELRISRMARYTSNFTAPAEPFADKGR